jgi:hypothetical protein
MQIFIVGPPRSGTTIVTQAINSNPEVKIFDEVDFLEIAKHGSQVVRRGRKFLVERGLWERFSGLEASSGSAAGALERVVSEAVAPKTVWGEKNPGYAEHLDELHGYFPEAFVVFVLRNPRQIVNSYLRHRRSAFREGDDFWIKDTVEEGLKLAETFVQPVLAQGAGLHVLRYEDFVADPATALDRLFAGQGLRFSPAEISRANRLPEGVADEQFYRNGAPLPWKVGNLSPVADSRPAQQRLDPEDPAWTKVDALAERLGYG